MMISIIIPIYNAGKQLNRMMTCLWEQTYQNYEVLLINDGSTDETEDVCREAVAKDNRIHYFYQKNAGVSVARNFGLKKAKGEYILFLDADDEIEKNYLETLMKACFEADIAVCDVISEDEYGTELKRFTLPNQRLTQEEALNYLLQRKGINSGPCAKIFKRKIVGDLEFPLMKAYEDIIFVEKAFYKAETIAVVNTTAYHYIQNTKGAMGTFLKTPSRDIIHATDLLATDAIQDKRMKDECLYITLSHLYQYVIPLLSKAKEHREFIEDAQNVFKKYKKNIIKNKAFPIKEKVVYLLFGLGWSYQDRKIRRVIR